MKIKIAKLCWNSEAPHCPTDKRRMLSVGSAIGGALPLALRWEATSLPSARRLRPPRDSHRRASPAAAALRRTWCGTASDRRLVFQNTGWVIPRSTFQVQSSSVQKARVFIAAVRDELQILPIRHLILINLKCGHFHRVRFVFVVPAKCSRSAAASPESPRRQGSQPSGE